MMGQPSSPGPKLFYYDLRLEDRVPSDHLLRQIRARVDFDFVSELVQNRYGVNGHVSVPPPVILKLMLLLFLYDVPSERELMRSLPYRLDWLWFLGYDLDSVVPDHSVLSKARKRWGVEVFETVFARGVAQCVQHDLVNGRTIHMDGSLIDANASNNSVVKGPERLIEGLRRMLRGEIVKLNESEPPAEASLPGFAASNDPPSGESSPPASEAAASASGTPERTGTKKYYQPKNRSMISTTDPDAAIVRKGPHGPRARYKHHRVVDDHCGVVTAVQTTAGDVEENARLMALVDQHEKNTAMTAKTVVADKQYGTADNFRDCHQRGLISHMADRSLSQIQKGTCQGIFGLDRFTYDPVSDTYRCPAGQTLTRRKHKHVRRAYEYACKAAVCRTCALRDQCTRAKKGAARTIVRHEGQEAIDAARAQSHSRAGCRDRRRRKWRMEGSFGDAATHHGFKRARWRRLWRQQIQDYLIATVQNLRTLIRHARRPLVPANAQVLASAFSTAMGTWKTLWAALAFAWMPGIGFSATPEPTSKHSALYPLWATARQELTPITHQSQNLRLQSLHPAPDYPRLRQRPCP
jgi:transposase